MFNIIKSIKSLSKLKLILDCIEEIKTNNKNSLYIKFKSDFILATEGSQVFYTKDGQAIIQSKRLHMNPNIDMANDLENNKLISVNKKIQNKLDEKEKSRLEALENYQKNINECTCK